MKEKYEVELISHEELMHSIEGWFAYAIWANTYKMRKSIVKDINANLFTEIIECKHLNCNIN